MIKVFLMFKKIFSKNAKKKGLKKKKRSTGKEGETKPVSG